MGWTKVKSRRLFCDQFYGRHRYLDEKRQAFEALAAQVDRILNPRDNVIPLPPRGGNPLGRAPHQLPAPRLGRDGPRGSRPLVTLRRALARLTIRADPGAPGTRHPTELTVAIVVEEGLGLARSRTSGGFAGMGQKKTPDDAKSRCKVLNFQEGLHPALPATPLTRCPHVDRRRSANLLPSILARQHDERGA